MIEQQKNIKPINVFVKPKNKIERKKTHDDELCHRHILVGYIYLTLPLQSFFSFKMK